MVLDVDGASDIGHVRVRNEDQFLIADLERRLVVEKAGVEGTASLSPAVCRGKLLVVADGIGGHGGGDLASAVAMDELVRRVAYGVPWIDRHAGRTSILPALQSVFEDCQRRVEAVAAHKGLADQRPGTTLTMAIVIEGSLYLVHAGDSRCYLHRDGALHQLTRDHTIGEQIKEARRRAGEGASDEPGRFDNLLSNAVGGGTAELYADAWELPLCAGDVLLLCTDGLTRHVSDADIAAQLARGEAAAACCANFIEAALAAGGRDNITAVACRVQASTTRQHA